MYTFIPQKRIDFSNSHRMGRLVPAHNKHICAKKWLCHNIKRKKIIISILIIKWLIIHKYLVSLHTKIHCAKFG